MMMMKKENFRTYISSLVLVLLLLVDGVCLSEAFSCPRPGISLPLHCTQNNGGTRSTPTSIIASSSRTLSMATTSSQGDETDDTGKDLDRPSTPAAVATTGVVVDDDDDEDETTDDENSRTKNSGLLRLAQLSLEDYEWRNSVFKRKEADRMVEQSLARMMGDDPSYVRPMDASDEKIGPLGLLEKSSVDWLKKVIDEEARRAKKIVLLGGMMVRPIDSASPDGELGPLGFLEKQVVDFLETISSSERERSRTNTLRPKDLEESKRGPLGQAELRAVEAIREVLDSEKLRMEQSQRRESIVRPIDVPGPLGEFEMAVLEVVKAEQQRNQDLKEKPGAVVVRPKDSSRKGPLGELEEQAVDAVRKLTEEEKERLRNIQRFLDENRPMEQNRESPLGIIEALAVGIVRAPILLFQILARVKELLSSEYVAEADAELLRRKMRIEEVKKREEKEKE